METVVPTATCHRIRVATGRAVEFIDLTDRIDALAAAPGLDAGIVNIQSLHTTTAIVVNEHEPLLLADFDALLARSAPADAGYRHDDMTVRTVNLAPGERANGHAHCRALLLPTSVLLNVAGGRLQLGRWQRVFLVELDGPRDREVSVLILGEACGGRRRGLRRTDEDSTTPVMLASRVPASEDSCYDSVSRSKNLLEDSL